MSDDHEHKWIKKEGEEAESCEVCGLVKEEVESPEAQPTENEQQ